MSLEKIYLVNLETEEKANSDRNIVVKSANSFVGFIDIVGVKTSALGQSMNMNFKYSVEVRKAQYNSEKFLYLPRTEEVFEIKYNTKAKLPFNMLLQVANCRNTSKMVAAIKTFIAASEV